MIEDAAVSRSIVKLYLSHCLQAETNINGRAYNDMTIPSRFIPMFEWLGSGRIVTLLLEGE